MTQTLTPMTSANPNQPPRKPRWNPNETKDTAFELAKFSGDSAQRRRLLAHLLEEVYPYEKVRVEEFVSVSMS